MHGLHLMTCCFPLGHLMSMTPEQLQAWRWEREIDERNRPLTDDELDAMFPEGYKACLESFPIVSQIVNVIKTMNVIYLQDLCYFVTRCCPHRPAMCPSAPLPASWLPPQHPSVA